MSCVSLHRLKSVQEPDSLDLVMSVFLCARNARAHPGCTNFKSFVFFQARAHAPQRAACNTMLGLHGQSGKDEREAGRDLPAHKRGVTLILAHA